MFKQATLTINNHSIYIFETIPIVNSIIVQLKIPTSSSLQGMKNYLSTSMRHCFIFINDTEDDTYYTIDNILDPRFKGSVFINKVKFNLIISKVIYEVQKTELPVIDFNINISNYQIHTSNSSIKNN